MICKHCKKEFPNDLSDDVDNCILCCDKTENANCTDEKIKEFRNSLYQNIVSNHNSSIIKNIYFPEEFTFDEPSDNNMLAAVRDKLASKLVIFQDCTFLSNVTKQLFRGVRVAEIKYANCHFQTWNYSFPGINIEYHACDFEEYILQGNEKYMPETNLQFFNCSFEKIDFNYYIFNKKIFNFTEKNKSYAFKEIILRNSIVNESLVFSTYDQFEPIKSALIKKLDLSETVFRKKVKLQKCKINHAIFLNTKFNDLADFYETEFDNNVNFERTDFGKISVFSGTLFNCNVRFDYTKFFGKAIFRDTIITGKLDLRNAIFSDDANFLDITSKKRNYDENKKRLIGNVQSIEVANRETARIIKNFYDNSNNIIEANRFYALEMEEREKELEEDKKNNFFEWVVFKAHKISSNHSQDWVLALFWIINITFLYSFLDQIVQEPSIKNFPKLFLVIPMTLLEIAIIYSFGIKNKVMLSILSVLNYVVYSVISNDYLLVPVSNNFNPFSIMTEKGKLNIITLIYKITIAYLIYQFVISIRQNTKRK